VEVSRKGAKARRRASDNFDTNGFDLNNLDLASRSSFAPLRLCVSAVLSWFAMLM
jgi:hypothetical protein